jgi:two-component system, LuxR family, response regulator FixJ
VKPVDEEENMFSKSTSDPANSTNAPLPGAMAARLHAAAADEVFIVDDEPMIGELLQLTLSSEGFRVATFRNGGSFIEAARLRTPACVILDVYMPDRSGLDILKDIDAHTYGAPILVMSGHATIAMAVDAVKNGAFDIIEKPFMPGAIVERVRAVTEAWTRNRTSVQNISKKFPDGRSLTSREADVLAQIIGAASNKEAGFRLGISPRTVEVHRARIMAKLGAKNTADLVRIALASPNMSRDPEPS